MLENERHRKLVDLALTFLIANLGDLLDDGLFEDWPEPPTEEELHRLHRELARPS